tara:strand:+ start:1334 stop:2068 length:735 start_codon:yes stop_codon:yes gene_type:complete
MSYSLYIKNKSDYKILKINQSGGKYKNSYQHISVSKIAKLMDDNNHLLKDIKHKYKNKIFEMFPNKIGVNRGLLQINKVGIFSLTKPDSAQHIVDIIKQYIDPKKSIMINATSGIGGEIINHYDKFKFIYGYELSPIQFKLLKNNVSVYKIDNVKLFNLDYTQNINKQKGGVVIIDPPWGGLNYKEHKSLELKLGNYTMAELVEMIDTKLILLKLPINHDLTKFHNFKVHKVGNYMIIVIKNKN